MTNEIRLSAHYGEVSEEPSEPFTITIELSGTGDGVMSLSYNHSLHLVGCPNSKLLAELEDAIRDIALVIGGLGRQPVPGSIYDDREPDWGCLEPPPVIGGKRKFPLN